MIETTRPKEELADRQQPARRPFFTRSLLGWLVPPLALIALIIGWEVGVRVNDTPKWFLPPPSDVGRELIESRRMLWEHTWTTLQEVMIGYSIALVVGIASAVAIASSRVVERTIYPVIVASQAIPIIALAPI